MDETNTNSGKQCLQCLKQQIKCDQSLPECSRCRRLFISCSFNCQPEDNTYQIININETLIYKRRYNYNMNNNRPLYSFRSYSPDPLDSAYDSNHPTYLIHMLNPNPLYPYPRPFNIPEDINLEESKVNTKIKLRDSEVLEDIKTNDLKNSSEDPICDSCFKNYLKCNGILPICNQCSNKNIECEYTIQQNSLANFKMKTKKKKLNDKVYKFLNNVQVKNSN